MTAKLMWPEKLCVNWVGDTAMRHNAIEMETALKESLPILTVVSNNSSYAVYSTTQRSRLPEAINNRVVSPSSITSDAVMAESFG